MKKQPISLKAEREILILAMKENMSTLYSLDYISDSNGNISELYMRTFIDAKMQSMDSWIVLFIPILLEVKP